MRTCHSNTAIIKCEIILRQTEARIDAIEQRLLMDKLTSRKFIQLYRERGALLIQRRTALKKLENARKAKKTLREAEYIVKSE